jgi:hypothetical protein
MKESRQHKQTYNIKRYALKERVQIFDVVNPWVYVPVPKKYTDETKHLAERGLVAIAATVSKSTWKTSLMPKGDGTQFVPLPAKVRKAENIKLGDTIQLTFTLRKR